MAFTELPLHNIPTMKVRYGWYWGDVEPMPKLPAYTKFEIQFAWATEGGQGSAQARDVTCNDTVSGPGGMSEDDAVALAKYWMLNHFNIPTCTYYDKDAMRLSLYCGDAGSTDVESLKRAALALFAGYEIGCFGGEKC